jgi:hypothetical protein
VNKTLVQLAFQFSSLVLIFSFSALSRTSGNSLLVYSLSSFLATWLTYQIFSSRFLVGKHINSLRALGVASALFSLTFFILSSFNSDYLALAAISLATASPLVFLLYDHLSSLVLGISPNRYFLPRLIIVALSLVLVIVVARWHTNLILCILNLRNLILLVAFNDLVLACESDSKAADPSLSIKVYQVNNPLIVHSLIPALYYAPLYFIAGRVGGAVASSSLAVLYTLAQVQNSVILRMIDIKMKRLELFDIDKLVLSVVIVATMCQFVLAAWLGASIYVPVVSFASALLLWFACKYYAIRV